jgi:hypothetical protein
LLTVLLLDLFSSNFSSDKVYRLLAHGRWFSPGTPASSTTKTGCHDHDIAEILLKVALNPINQIKSNQTYQDYERSKICQLFEVFHFRRSSVMRFIL